jgi:hypothetical protein
MSNSIIRAELETRLKTWADAQSPKIPIAFQNVPFTKPTTSGSVFLECFLIPNVTMNIELSGQRSTLYGIFQVNCWVQQGKGMKAAETLAQSVINIFPMLPKTGDVSIEGTPTAEPSLLDDSGWVVVPVTIKYRYEKVS